MSNETDIAQLRKLLAEGALGDPADFDECSRKAINALPGLLGEVERHREHCPKNSEYYERQCQSDSQRIAQLEAALREIVVTLGSDSYVAVRIARGALESQR